MRHAQIQERKQPLNFVKALIIRCLELNQLKETHSDTIEQESPMTLDRSPEIENAGT